MVQVPIGGLLNIIEIFPSTGECMVVKLDSVLTGGGYCACVNTDRSIRRKIVEDSMAGRPCDCH